MSAEVKRLDSGRQSTGSPYQADPLPDLLAERQELVWLIEGWLEAGTLAVMVGPEGSFKSFIAIDWAMSVATGAEWHGSRIKAGRVLYIAGEGRTGVIRRMRGWSDIYEAKVLDDLYIGRSPTELISVVEADRLAQFLESKDEWALIIIDTLARNFGAGNENSQQDMGNVISNIDLIRAATGAAVLLVHHSPFEGRSEGNIRPRGSSALSGGVDASFTCQYDVEQRVITLACPKQKDDERPEPVYLTYDIVDVGDKDNFGNPVTTCVLKPTDQRPSRKQQGRGKNQRLLVEGLVTDSRVKGNGEDTMLVSTTRVMEILSAAKLGRSSRHATMAWLGKQPWCSTAAGGYSIDIEAITHR